MHHSSGSTPEARGRDAFGLGSSTIAGTFARALNCYVQKDDITMRKPMKTLWRSYLRRSFLRRTIALVVLTMAAALMQHAVAQDQSDQDDPPSRVARLGYLQGSVS